MKQYYLDQTQLQGKATAIFTTTDPDFYAVSQVNVFATDGAGG